MNTGFVFSILATALFAASVSAQQANNTEQRQLVTMPSNVVDVMRFRMTENLSTLNLIINELSVNNLEKAGQLAEQNIGISSMGKHRASGIMPGKFMPPEMRTIARGMHQSATDFAKVAKTGDKQAALAALSKLSSHCVACHSSFRVR